MKLNTRDIWKWIFTIAAVVVAALSAMKGNLVGFIWPLLATGYHWAANAFHDLCDELIEANHDNAKVIDEIVDANHGLAEALKKEQAKNAELQEEINRLKA